VVPVRNGHRQRFRFEDERKRFRIAAINDRLAKQPAIVHDVDKIAQPNDETGDRDVGPAGIHVERRPDFIERRAQRIGFLSIATRPLRAIAPCSCRFRPYAPTHLCSRRERKLAVLDRSEQRKQR